MRKVCRDVSEKVDISALSHHCVHIEIINATEIVMFRITIVN
jgi:hypothetical protein